MALLVRASTIEVLAGTSSHGLLLARNEFGPWISQDLFENVIMTGLTDKSRKVNGKPTSLAELGYDRLGMDDGKSLLHLFLRAPLAERVRLSSS